MNDNKAMLGTAPIGKLLFKLAVPTVVAQLINMLYNIVDRIYIGHIKDVGSLALTGVGVCMPIIMIISAFAALIASGGALGFNPNVKCDLHGHHGAEHTCGDHGCDHKCH